MHKLVIHTDTLWGLAKELTNALFIRVGWAVLITAPALASISASLQEERNIPDSILHLYNFEPIFVPLNMDRLFWASACLIIAKILYELFASSKVKHSSFGEWAHSRMGKSTERKIKLARENISKGQLSLEMREAYEKRENNAETLRVVPLIIIFAFQLCAIMLVLRIVGTILSLMYRQHSPIQLLFS